MKYFTIISLVICVLFFPSQAESTNPKPNEPQCVSKEDCWFFQDCDLTLNECKTATWAWVVLALIILVVLGTIIGILSFFFDCFKKVLCCCVFCYAFKKEATAV